MLPETGLSYEAEEWSDALGLFPAVSKDSRTPYTDATQCKNGERIKRPMNAFMIWSQMQRKSLAVTCPGLHNAEISKRLGREWNSLTADQRRPFITEAERLRKFHLLEYPDYKYQPRKRPANDGVSITSSNSSKTSSSKSRHRYGKRSKLNRKKATSSTKARSTVRDDRSVASLSSRGSVISDVTESFPDSDFSMCGDVEDLEEDFDYDSIATTPEDPFSSWSQFATMTAENFDSVKPTAEEVSIPSPTPTGRSTFWIPELTSDAIKSAVNCVSSDGRAFVEWLEDYITPEVSDLLADDWLAEVENNLLCEVAVL